MRKDPVSRYRRAAMKLYGLTEKQAERSIYAPGDDPGGWAPKALAIINFEHGDLGRCDYYARNGLDECIKLGQEAGVGFVEYINPAVAAVWE